MNELGSGPRLDQRRPGDAAELPWQGPRTGRWVRPIR